LKIVGLMEKTAEKVVEKVAIRITEKWE